MYFSKALSGLNGSVCTTKSDCVNLECDSITKRCYCPSNSYTSGGSCSTNITFMEKIPQNDITFGNFFWKVLFRNPGQSCNATFQCTSNSNCDYNSLTCVCNYGYYLNSSQCCGNSIKSKIKFPQKYLENIPFNQFLNNTMVIRALVQPNVNQDLPVY